VFIFQIAVDLDPPTCTRHGHRHRVTATRGSFDTIVSPDDEHDVVETCRELKI